MNKRNKYKVDSIFYFILKSSSLDGSKAVTINEIKGHFGINKTAVNNFLQYLYKNKSIKRYKLNKLSRYYSIVNEDDYMKIVNKIRKNKEKVVKNSNENRLLDRFIFGGNVKRMLNDLSIS